MDRKLSRVVLLISLLPSVTIYLDDSDSQISSPDSFYADPDYPIDSYLS
jgi:hypothetical protein